MINLKIIQMRNTMINPDQGLAAKITALGFYPLGSGQLKHLNRLRINTLFDVALPGQEVQRIRDDLSKLLFRRCSFHSSIPGNMTPEVALLAVC